jgi:hypothetical protein
MSQSCQSAGSAGEPSAHIRAPEDRRDVLGGFSLTLAKPSPERPPHRVKASITVMVSDGFGAQANANRSGRICLVPDPNAASFIVLGSREKIKN